MSIEHEMEYNKDNQMERTWNVPESIRYNEQIFGKIIVTGN